MKRLNASSERFVWGAAAAIFTSVTVLGAADLFSDFGQGASLEHMATEGTVFVLGLLGVGLATWRLAAVLRLARTASARAESLAGQLSQKEEEARRWREEARHVLRGLAEAMDRQFDEWGLSSSEKEVALLLLKGLSHKEIAQLRSVTEATARQQARAVYKKGQLSGRHDLAAFFLEDLMVPSAQDS